MIGLRVPDLPGQMVSHKGTIIIAPGGYMALYKALESTRLVESRITPHCQYHEYTRTTEVELSTIALVGKCNSHSIFKAYLYTL